MEDFKKYNKNMKILITNKVAHAATEEAIFQNDMQYHPQNKCVYEVRQEALAAPYWQVKRNKNGRELHHLQTDRMRENWAIDVEIEKITERFK